MKLGELLPILDYEAEVVVHTDGNKGFRSIVNKVQENEKYLDRQVDFLTHFVARNSIGYEIYLKGE